MANNLFTLHGKMQGSAWDGIIPSHPMGRDFFNISFYLVEPVLSVKTQFSSASFVINESHTALDPDQVNNILFIRFIKKMKLAERSVI
jgi:hypothetical protein